MVECTGDFNPLPQSIDNDVPNHKAAEAALVVHQMRVPLAENIIGPFVGGMAEIVAARIEGQLVQQVWIEISVLQDASICRPQNLQSFVQQFLIASPGYPGTLDHERNGANALVVVRFAARA